jgi:zinc protease
MRHRADSKALVETKKAASVETGAMQAYDPGVLMAFAVVPGKGDLSEASDAMVKTIEEFAKISPTKEEVDRARAELMKSKELTLSDSARLGFELSEWIAKGDWRLFFLDRDRLLSVSPEDVQHVAAKYLLASNRTLGMFLPTAAPVRAQVPVRLDTAAMLKNYKGGEAVALGEVNATPDNIEARTERSAAQNGLRLALLPKSTRGHLVVGALVLHYGSEDTLKNLSMVSKLTAAMLNRGTTKHTRQQLSDELDRLKAQVSFRSDPGQVSVSFETQRDNLPAVISLVAEMLKEPSFPDNEFEALKQENLAELEAALKDPQTLASKEFERSMNPYSTEHPRYAATLDEQITQIGASTLDALKNFHREFYGAQAAQLAVVGDFDESVIKKLGTDLFGSWQRRAVHQIAAAVL